MLEGYGRSKQSTNFTSSYKMAPYMLLCMNLHFLRSKLHKFLDHRTPILQTCTSCLILERLNKPFQTTRNTTVNQYNTSKLERLQSGTNERHRAFAIDTHATFVKLIVISIVKQMLDPIYQTIVQGITSKTNNHQYLCKEHHTHTIIVTKAQKYIIYQRIRNHISHCCYKIQSLTSDSTLKKTWLIQGP